jgi:tellurite resistance protein TehA-like permease
MAGWRAADAVERVVGSIPAASGAVVMGTGIVSIALALVGRETLSRILLGAAAAAWIALGVMLTARATGDPERVRREARAPAALSGVAATAVLGARLTTLGWRAAGIALLAVAFALWCALLAPVLMHWDTPTVGASLMLTISTESLAVLAATIADREHEPWLLDAALAVFLLGLACYAFVLSRFDARQLTVGRGDHWMTGGALAISTLAAAHIALAAKALHELGGIDAAFKGILLALWVVTIAWLPILLAAELLRPRLAYDVRRWATVFPVGMYAACSYLVGAAVKAPAITDFGHVWVWGSVALWLVVAGAMVRRGVQLAGGQRLASDGPQRARRPGP